MRTYLIRFWYDNTALDDVPRWSEWFCLNTKYTIEEIFYTKYSLSNCFYDYEIVLD